jgi:hypothetical protein
VVAPLSAATISVAAALSRSAMVTNASGSLMGLLGLSLED